MFDTLVLNIITTQMLVMPYSSSNIYNPQIQFAPLGSFQINRTTTIKMSLLQTSQILTRWAATSPRITAQLCANDTLDVTPGFIQQLHYKV